MAFSFEKSKFPYNGASLDPASIFKDTIKDSLRTFSSFYSAFNKFSVFKLSEKNSFKVQVELSSTEDDYSTEAIPRKIAHFHLLIK